jgi:hypothetical protein
MSVTLEMRRPHDKEKVKLSSDGDNSGSKKYKRGYDGAFGEV